MNVRVDKGKYVIAVSGGVDSMVLLDILSRKSGLELVVAHFNHGIRPDSGQDEKLVAASGSGYGLKTEIGHGRLGKSASEATARTARYEFLNQVCKKHGCKAIITAHHQDDLIETALLNIVRGTGRRGVSSIASNKAVIRPLLKVPKAEIIEYARKYDLDWHEDPTNRDDSYARNYLRHNIMPKLTVAQRSELLNNIDKVANINILADGILATLSQNVKTMEDISRHKFIELDPEIADELVVYWLRQWDQVSFDSKSVKRISAAIKTANPGKSYDIDDHLKLIIKPDVAILDYRT